MKNLNSYLEEGRTDYLNKTIAPFEQACCQTGIALYYAYILKHADKAGNGFASLEQLERVYSKLGALAHELKKHANMFKDVIK